MNHVPELVLAMLHHLGILAVFGFLLAELAILRLPICTRMVDVLARVDLGYGLAAGLVLAAGLARVLWGEKGAAFYTENPVFWVKLGLFALIALISIRPTLAYLRWRRRARASASLPQGGDIAQARLWVALQVGLFAGLPLCAALMARGLGL